MVTLGTEFIRKNIQINDNSVIIQIWDTTGQDTNFITVPPAMIRSVCGVIFVYDCSNLKSFLNLNNWISKVDNHIKFNTQKIILGNKSDLFNKTVDRNLVEKFARSNNCLFYECSCKTGQNIEYSIISLSEKVYDKVCDNFIKADEDGTEGVKINKNSNKKIKLKAKNKEKISENESSCCN